MSDEQIEQMSEDDSGHVPASKALVAMTMLGLIWQENQERVRLENEKRHQYTIDVGNTWFNFVFPETRDYTVEALHNYLRKFKPDELVKTVRSKTREFFRQEGYGFVGQAHVLVIALSIITEFGIKMAGHAVRMNDGIPDYRTIIKQFRAANPQWRACLEALRTYSMDKTPTGDRTIQYASKSMTKSVISEFSCDWANFPGFK